jgi:hypothetical protein
LTESGVAARHEVQAFTEVARAVTTRRVAHLVGAEVRALSAWTTRRSASGGRFFVGPAPSGAFSRSFEAFAVRHPV